jgi:hypothetical protein
MQRRAKGFRVNRSDDFGEIRFLALRTARSLSMYPSMETLNCPSAGRLRSISK